MINAIKSIQQDLKEATGYPVYYRRNIETRPRYPFITFSYNTQQNQDYSDDYYITIHVYDKDISPERIETICGNIRRYYTSEFYSLKRSGLLMRFQSLTVDSLPILENLENQERQLLLITRVYY